EPYIGHERRPVWRSARAKLEPLLLGLLAQLIDHLGHHQRDIRSLRVQLEALAVDARVLEQGVDEVRKPPRSALNFLDRPFRALAIRHLSALFVEPAQLELDAGQRSTELMRDEADEVVLGLTRSFSMFAREACVEQRVAQPPLLGDELVREHFDAATLFCEL